MLWFPKRRVRRAEFEARSTSSIPQFPTTRSDSSVYRPRIRGRRCRHPPGFRPRCCTLPPTNAATLKRQAAHFVDGPRLVGRTSKNRGREAEHRARDERSQEAASDEVPAPRQFSRRGQEVTEGMPAAFPPLPEGRRSQSAALARWLVDENNPLTARVIANRYWEQIFGIGIVSSSEDFGSQGEPPSHPELLDWLATELVRLKWDTKAFLKLLVTSAAYRQSSQVTPELHERDPDNRLLAAARAFGFRPKWCATRRWRRRAAEPQDVRAAGQAAAAVAGSERGVRRQHRLADERRRRPLSPRALHDVAAVESVSVDGHVRRAQSRSLHRSPRAHEHAAAGAGDVERPGLRRSRAGAGSPDRCECEQEFRTIGCNRPSALPGSAAGGRRACSTRPAL